MMTEKRTSGRKGLAAALVLAVILVSSVLYFSGLMNQQAAADAGTVSSLQGTIASLESNYQALQTTTVQAGSQNGSTLLGINPEAIYARTSRSVVTVQGDALVTVNTIFGPQSTSEHVLGSGFVTLYQNQLYVITNYHVVQGVSNISVTFSDGNAYPARVVGSDPYSDLAVVSAGAPSAEFSPLALSPSASVQVGEPVVAIGNPFGLSGSVTYGIISQLGRTLSDPTAGNFSISDVIQFSAPINPGNSGGPLLSANSTVIGITTAVVSGSQGVGFAIPSDTITRELPSLVSTGGYKLHPYLGIGGTDMNYELAQSMGTNFTYGVLIETVVGGGPASVAGLRAGTRTATVGTQQYIIGGDIIVSINGTRIISQDALATYLETHAVAGQTVSLGIVRNGTLATFTLVLGTRPPLPGQ